MAAALVEKEVLCDPVDVVRHKREHSLGDFLHDCAAHHRRVAAGAERRAQLLTALCLQHALAHDAGHVVQRLARAIGVRAPPARLERRREAPQLLADAHNEQGASLGHDLHQDGRRIGRQQRVDAVARQAHQ